MLKAIRHFSIHFRTNSFKILKSGKVNIEYLSYKYDESEISNLKVTQSKNNSTQNSFFFAGLIEFNC